MLCWLCQRFLERLLGVAQRHAVLRALWPGHRRHYACEIQFQLVRKYWIGRRIGAEKSLLFGVSVDQLYEALVASGESQISECLVIDREKSHRRAIFRRHIR